VAIMRRRGRRRRHTGCAGGGVVESSNTAVQAVIRQNTIDSNDGNGLEVTTQAALAGMTCFGNCVTNSGGYGVTVSAGTTTVNDRLLSVFDYNNVWTATSGNYSGISAGAHDLSVDPGYANAAAGDYTPTNTALNVTVPVP